MKVSEVAGGLGRTEDQRKRFIPLIGKQAPSALSVGRRSLREPRRIARHRVDLQIDAIAGHSVTPGRYLEGMVDQKDIETGVLDLVYSQRSPIERDRAFGRDEPREI